MTIVGKVETKKMTKGLDMAKNKVKDFAKSIPGVSTVMKIFSKAGLNPVTIALAAVAVGAIAVVAAFKLFMAAVRRIRKEMEALDKIAKVASSLDLTSAALIGLHHAATLSGASIEVMDSSLKRMVKRISEAAAETGAARQALVDLKLEAKALNAMSPDKQFKAIAEALKGIALQGDKVKIVMAIMGRQGADLLNTMADGAAGLNAHLEDTERLWLAVSDIDMAKVEEANDQLFRLGEVLHGINVQATVNAAPAIAQFAFRLTEVAISARDAADSIGEVFGVSITNTAVNYFMDSMMHLHASFLRLRAVIYYSIAALDKFRSFLARDDSLKAETRQTDLLKVATDDARKARDLLATPYSFEDWLANAEFNANLVTESTIKLGKAIEDASSIAEADESMESLIKKYKELYETIGMTSREIEILGTKTEKTNQALVQQAKDLDASITKKEEDQIAIEDGERATKKAEQTIIKYYNAAAALDRGMSARQLNNYNQSRLITDEMRERLRVAERLLTKAEELAAIKKKDADELKSLKKTIIEATKTPEQKLLEIDKKIFALYTNREISARQALKYYHQQKIALGLIKEEEKELQILQDERLGKLAGAAEFGSKAARDIILASRFPKDEPQIGGIGGPRFGPQQLPRPPQPQPQQQPDKQSDDQKLATLLEQINGHVARMVPQVALIAQRADDPRLADI